MSKAMEYEEALKEVKYRIQFCGNVYGAKWKGEEPFLKACKSALKDAIKYQESKLTSEERDILESLIKYAINMKGQGAIENVADNDEVAESLFCKLGLIKG